MSHNQIGFPWGQDDIVFYLQWVFNIFQLSTLYGYITYTTYIVFFYIGILVVILILIDIAYVSYSFQQKKFKYVWPLKLLRSVCAFLVTVFFFNFIGKPHGISQPFRAICDDTRLPPQR